MIYTVLISANPSKESIHEKALAFCVSALAEGNDIKQVFFMHEAVKVVESNMAGAWSSLAAEFGIQLQTCSSTAEDFALNTEKYPVHFNADGTSSLADAIMQSDKLEQFS